MREDGAMEGGAREDGAVVEDGALEGEVWEDGAVREDYRAVEGGIREDGAVGQEVMEDALREQGAAQRGAREGEHLRENDPGPLGRQPLPWTSSWKLVLGISAVGIVGVGILIYVLFRQQKRMKGLEAALEQWKAE